MEHKYIEIVGARVNNLKNISLKIPKNKITIFTGVSGSGKSSIVFETIAQEAGRQLNETFSKFIQIYLPKHGHPDVDAIENLSLAITVDQKRIGGNSRSTLGTITDINPLLRLLFSRIGQPHIGPSNYFSFNDPNGMCKTCEGIGRIVTLDLDKALDKEKSLNEGAILLPGFKPGN
jgi:excinuclease UvrABC ATPase subunit